MHTDMIYVQNLSEIFRTHVIDTGINGSESSKNYFKYTGLE